jgi:AraC-like DNA-binding protein
MKTNAQRPSAQATPDFFSPHVSEARRFYLDLKPARQRPLVVVCGGVERTRADYRIHRAGFPFVSLEYVARGRGTVRLKGRTHTLQPGRVFTYGPGVAHDITANAHEPLVKYFVNFTGTAAAALLARCQLPSGTVAQVFPPNEPQGIFDELIQSGLKGSRHSAELCARLVECLALKIRGARAPLGVSQTLAFTTFQECREHIRQHFLRLQTLEQISDECHLNNAYLCRLFRRYENPSPYQYLLRLKVNFAAERLQQPGAMVKQVAEEAGFADPFHFSRVFRSILGMSPAKFRTLT